MDSALASCPRPRASTFAGLHPVKDGVAFHTIGRLKHKAHAYLSKPTNFHPDQPSDVPGRRVVSMPPPPTSSIVQAQIDIDNDRRARGIDSPPIVDFTKFEDTYRGPRSGSFEGLVAGTRTRMRSKSGSDMKPALKRSAPSKIAQRTVAGMAPHPASARKPDPRLVLSSLADILGDSVNIEDHLNTHELLALHQLDQLDFEERDRVRKSLITNGKLDVRFRPETGVLAVFGQSLRKASIYASVNVSISNREHEIPIVVVNAIEELYRTGIYQSNLFRSLPNQTRLQELLHIYDSEEQPPGSVITSRQLFGYKVIPNSGFGAMTSLHLESTPDVCALLTSYMAALKEPILSPFLFQPLWDWCCIEDEKPDTARHPDSFGPRLSSIPLARTYTSPTESMHITVAQLLLQLLPSPNFSLLVYLLAFFSQVTLVREENGVGVEDLATIYGGTIFGGRKAGSALSGSAVVSDRKSSTTQTRGEGDIMMRWFLRRWAPISDGLFDVIEDAKMGIFRRTLARRDSFGKDILQSWPTKSDDGLSSETHVDDSATQVPALFEQGVDLNTSSLSEGSHYEENPEISWVDPSLHSTPCLKSRTRSQDRLLPDSPKDGGVSSLILDGDYVILGPPSADHQDDTLDIMHLTTRDDNYSASSTMALDERLMDLSMSNLLNETCPPSAPVPANNHSSTIPSIIVSSDVSTNSGQPSSMEQVLKQAAHLEAELSERTNSLTAALKDLTKSRLQCSKFQERIRMLESELRSSGEQSQTKTEPHGNECEEKLKAALKERDDALERLNEIKKLVAQN